MTTTNRRLLMAANRPIDVLRKFTFDRTGGDANINTCTARIKRLRGNTIVWNQLLKTFAEADLKPNSSYYNTCVFDEQKITLTGWKPYGIFRFNTKLTERINHKLYLRIDAVITSTRVQLQLGSGNNREYLHNGINRYIKVCKDIGNETNMDYISTFSVESVETTIDVVFNNFMCIDLTLMFGAGNEPTSVEEFESMFPLDYYEYNAGELLSFNGDSIKAVGFNQWDEQWEFGRLNITTGEPIESASAIRSANFIPVLPNVEYYAKNDLGQDAWGMFYDANKNLITGIRDNLNYRSLNNVSFTTPANAHYLRFYVINTTSYTSDICINISDPLRNGTYEPYIVNTKDISFYKSIRDANDNILFPYGLLSAGNVYDEVTATKAIKRIEVVDLGSLTWNYYTPLKAFQSNLPATIMKVKSSSIKPKNICAKYEVVKRNYLDNISVDKIIGFNTGSTGFYIRDLSFENSTAANFKAAMQGVMLYCELAEPIEVPLDNINLEYPAYRTGTEELLPANGAVPTTTPSLFDIRYKIGGRRN